MRSCDCSICRRRGALNFRVPGETLRLLTFWEALSEYRWGSRTAREFFCPRCGVLPFRRPSDPTPDERAKGAQPFDGWAVNVRFLEGLDIDALPVRLIRGSELRIRPPED